jgi:hypothetical protein
MNDSGSRANDNEVSDVETDVATTDCVKFLHRSLSNVTNNVDRVVTS